MAELKTLVGFEYKDAKWDKETKTEIPCTPHYVIIVRGSDNKRCFMRYYLSEKAKPYTDKDLATHGLEVLGTLLGKQVPVNGQEKEWNGRVSTEWKLARNAAPPAPPAPVPQQPGFQQAPPPMAPPVPPPPGTYQTQPSSGYAPPQDDLPHMPAPAPQQQDPFGEQY